MNKHRADDGESLKLSTSLPLQLGIDKNLRANKNILTIDGGFDNKFYPDSEEIMKTLKPGSVTIGFVGIGKMGAPMSKNLRHGDYTVVAYDTRPENVKAVAADGVQEAESLADLASRADVVITMLPDSDVVDAVVDGSNGLSSHLNKGKLIIDMSSSYPIRTSILASRVEEKGLHLIGAPVSGGVVGAEAATLAIMPGGPKEIVDAAMPIFETLGKTIVHIDETPESGHAMKCVNNFLSATSLLASMEAMVLASKLGLDPEKALQVFNGGSGMNSATKDKWPRFLLPRDFTCGFSTGLMHKDLSMGSDLAREYGVAAFYLNQARQMYGLGVQKFGPDSDQTELLQMFEEWSGKKVVEPPA